MGSTAVLSLTLSTLLMASTTGFFASARPARIIFSASPGLAFPSLPSTTSSAASTSGIMPIASPTMKRFRPLLRAVHAGRVDEDNLAAPPL